MGEYVVCNNELYHHGVKDMKWKIQNEYLKCPRTKLLTGIVDGTPK